MPNYTFTHRCMPHPDFVADYELADLLAAKQEAVAFAASLFKDSPWSWRQPGQAVILTDEAGLERLRVTVVIDEPSINHNS